MKPSQAEIKKKYRNKFMKKIWQGQLPDKHENYSCVGSEFPIDFVKGDATFGSTGDLTGIEKSALTLKHFLK